MGDWVCIYSRDSREFAVGKIYTTNEFGQLVDDEGDIRLTPELYNKSGGIYSFKEVPLDIENE